MYQLDATSGVSSAGTNNSAGESEEFDEGDKNDLIDGESF